MNTLRDEIAEICEAHFNDQNTWNYQQLADAILALPRIKEALSWHDRWMLHPTGERLSTPEEIDAFFDRVRDKTERLEYERLRAKFAGTPRMTD